MVADVPHNSSDAVAINPYGSFNTEMKRRGYEVQETTPPDCGGHPVRRMES